MIHRLFAELRRLRWKLALAYTVTTVLVLTALLGIFAFAVFAGGGTRDEQARYATGVLAQIAQRVAPTMAADPVDSVRLSVILTALLERSGINSTGTTAALSVSTGDDPNFDLSRLNKIYILALDPQNRLMASTTPHNQQVIGRPFDVAALPGLGGLLGGDLTRRPYLIDQAAGRGIIVVPVMGSQRLGTLVYVAEGLNEPFVDPLAVLAQFGNLIAWLTLFAAIIGLGFGLLTAGGLARRLRAIERVTAAWGRGDFMQRLDDRSADEIGQLSRQLNAVANQLSRLIQERQAFATLEERNRLARDLHDSVKQHVFAASMSLGAAQELWADDAAAAADLTRRAGLATAHAQHELTDILHALRPLALEHGGLALALGEMAAGWSAQTGIAATADVVFDGRLPAAAEEALFRVAQEALANVARHSGARRAALSLHEAGGRLTLLVADDGRGFDPSTARAGIGLSSMRERAAAIGAAFSVSSDSRGTEVRVALPLRGA